LIWPASLVAAIFMGFHGAYFGALSDACLKIGTGLEGASEGTTGFQDAITPPSSTNARLLNWLTTLILTGVAWYFFGVTGVAIFLVVRAIATIILGAMLKAEPPKKHFCRKVYSSMSNREADFAKAGDNVRAEAMRDLRE
jgi:hypothetical protein